MTESNFPLRKYELEYLLEKIAAESFGEFYSARASRCPVLLLVCTEWARGRVDHVFARRQRE